MFLQKPNLNSSTSFEGYFTKLMSFIDKNNLPLHVAITMDGNGRWAQQRKLPRTAGHDQGLHTVK